MKTEKAKQYLADQIAAAQSADARHDAAERNRIVDRLLGDDCGLTLRYIRTSLREAGLIHSK